MLLTSVYCLSGVAFDICPTVALFYEQTRIAVPSYILRWAKSAAWQTSPSAHVQKHASVGIPFKKQQQTFGL